jgi:hypothetical protein
MLQNCHAVSYSPSRMNQAGSKPAVRQSVFQLLTCPLCREYMRPPITLCQAGHNVCSSCRSSFLFSDGNKCPRCDRPLLDTRNVALETIARGLVYPCRYSSAGCREKLAMDDIVKHHAQCPHRSYDCPLRALEGCKWTGRYRISCEAARTDLRSRHVALIFLLLIIILSGGETESLGTAATTGRLYQLQMIGDGDCGDIF